MRDLVSVLKRDWRSLLATALCTAAATAVLIFGIVALTSSASADLADRVDHNAALAVQNVVIARSGVDTIICILAIVPEQRTNARIQGCMDAHGYKEFYTP